MRTSQRLDVRMPPAEVAAELKLSPLNRQSILSRPAIARTVLRWNTAKAIIRQAGAVLILKSTGEIKCRKCICVWMWAVRKSRLHLWIKEEIFWHLSAISRQWPARTGKRCLKTLVGFLAVSARKMLFPLKLILRFPDRLTIKRHLPLQGLDKYDALYGCNLRRAFSEISGLLEQKFNSSMMQRPLRWGNGLWSGDASRASSVCSSGNRLRQCIWGERISG